MTQKPVSTLIPLLLVSYEIAVYLSNDMYLPALPQMMADLGLTIKHAQLTLTAWFVGSASMPLIIGAISDRYGRRPVLLCGGILYILSTIACALVTNGYGLLTARLIEGGMVATMLVPAYACIHELYDHTEAIKILALMGSINVLAPAFGPLLGSLVLYFSNWRTIFYFIALAASIAIFLLALYMPETQPADKRLPIHLKRLLSEYGRVLCNRRFLQLSVVLGFIMSGFLAWITAGPLLVMVNFHYSAVMFGILQAFVFAANILGTRQVDFLLEKLGTERLIHLGLTITLVGGLLASLLAWVYPHHLYPFLGAMIIYSFGSALCFSPLNRLLIEASTEPMGVRVALFTVVLTSFVVLGSGVATVFFNGTILSLSLVITACIVLSSALMWAKKQ